MAEENRKKDVIEGTPINCDELVKALKEKDEILSQKDQEITGLKIENIKLKEALRKESEILSRDAERKVNKGLGEMIAGFLEILDNFERALSSFESGNSNSKEGLLLIKNQIEKFLASYGVKEIEIIHKPYDPNLCEIGEIFETEEEEPNEVIKVLRKGYLLNDKVLRTAIVSVAVPKKDNTNN